MKKQAAIDWPTVMKLFAGGALTGAGLGAGTSFLRHLQALKDQAQTDTSADDDVLYLNVPDKPEPAGKMRKKASTATFATGGMAGVLGTILAYNAVRSAYQKHLKKQLQRELDASQQIYLGGLQDESMGKQASQFGALSKGVGSIYLALFLSALGSGVVANRMLQKQFPPLKNPNRGKPRKIVVRTPNEAGGTDDSTVSTGKDVSPDAVENLVRTNLGSPKTANVDCSIADLVGAVAAGRGDEIRENIANLGIEAALDLCKGARHEKRSSLNHNMAITWICNDPLVSTAVAPLVAAEFHENGPWYTKAASAIPEELQEHLVGLTEAASQEVRKNFYSKIAGMSKIAMDLGSIGMATPLESAILAQSLGRLLSTNDQKSPQGEGDGSVDMADPSDIKANQPGYSDTPVSKDSGEPNALELSNDQAAAFWKEHGRDVDNALAKV